MYIRELRGTTPTPISTPGETIEINTLSYDVPTGIEIVRVMVKQTAGSATNFTFSIGNKSGYTSGTIDEKYLSGSVASSGILDEADVSAFCVTSSNGRLYFTFSPDSGSDNIYEYSIVYRR